MKIARNLAVLQEMREQPLWRLLAATKGPLVIALLQTLLLDTDKVLPGGVLHERLGRLLEQLRASGEELIGTPQSLISDWLKAAWLTRRLPAGAAEEEYELSVAAANALRFISFNLSPRSSATESRLNAVIQQLTRLAEATDANPASRIAALQRERERIDAEIEAVRKGRAQPLEDERALERTREIIALSDELSADFRRVRDEFDKLNRGLRQSLMESDGSRGQVLQDVFAGVDVIGESDAGKTFSAFWRLLTDPNQSSSLFEALDAVVNRPFAKQLSHKERKFLMDLVNNLMNEGGGVHDVLQNFARSLKNFVQSREFQENRRLHGLLKDASLAALQLKDELRPNAALEYSLMLTSSQIRSVAQWRLCDPFERVVDKTMPPADDIAIDLAMVSELVRQSEIDLRSLQEHIRAVLSQVSQASIAQILEYFPAEQGLGSVVGYIALGAKHGEMHTSDNLQESVTWCGADQHIRTARIPLIFFLRERMAELVDEFA